MNTQLCDSVTPFSKRALVLGVALALLLCGRSESQATLTPPSALGQYALLSDGSFSANGSTFEGNAGVKSGALSDSNHDTFKQKFSYQTGSLNLNHNTVNGITYQDVTLQTTINSIAKFSYDISQLQATLTKNNNYSGNTIINGNGGTNVVNFTGSDHNLNGTVTLNGGANDVFYINVFTHMDLTGVILANGVSAKNVFFNIVSGQDAKLSGTINGTVLAFNPKTKKTTSLEITGATINGDVVAGSLNINNTTINGIVAAPSDVAMAPEASSLAAMSLLGILLLASSFTRFWKKNKLQPAV